MREVRADASGVKQAARELGFDLAGIASAADPAFASAVERYQAWLDAGHAEAMEYLKRHAPLKAEPGRLLPGWKSVLCVAMLYGDERDHRLEDAARARVSQYTRGRDYHVVLSGRLRELGDRLRARHGFSWRSFVDAEPVMERFWAWRAGLGWIGRNTMLIHRKLGSFLFLGGLLTTAELEPDVPDTDHCGRCRKCVDACPTGAISESRWVESGKCIAYQTIENRGVIPEKVMERTGRWIAGCDVCQEVCPWNDPVTRGSAFVPANPAFHAPLEELAAWTEDRFREATRELAMGRMKYGAYLRNVAVAVANSDLAADRKRELLELIERNARGLPPGPGRDGAEAAVEWATRSIIDDTIVRHPGS